MGSVLSILNCSINQLFGYFSQLAFLRHQQEPKEINFNSLPDKVVVDIFSRMTPTELLATERVDRNWQRLVRETLEGRVETVVMRPTFEKEFYIWNVCQHMKNTRKTMSLSKMFKYIAKEKRKKIEEVVARDYYTWFEEGLLTTRGMQLFNSCLFKLSNVHCIVFVEMQISVQTLLLVFELCPMLKCIIINHYEYSSDLDFFELKSTKLNEDDWSNFLRTFGHRLVHLLLYQIINCDRLLQILEQSSNNNLELIGLEFGRLTEEIVTTIKQLQQKNNIYVIITFIEIQNVASSLDFIDEIVAFQLHWNLLPDNCQRLSLLRFETLQPESDSLDQFKPVEFSNLKHLSVIWVTDFKLRVLIGCRFPLLKELRLTFTGEDIPDVDSLLAQLFDQMPLLARIFINDFRTENQNQMPGPSILRLTNLTEIVWHIWIRANWNMQVMVDCFNVIGQVASLRKLRLDYWPPEQQDQWQALLNEQLTALKERRPNLVIESERQR